PACSDGKGHYGRGTARITVDGAGLRLALTLPLEEYVLGVAELPGTWSEKSLLEAQALTARTYVLKQGLDVADSTTDQVYAGLVTEARTHWVKAVNDTAGKVIAYNGTLASTFYYSSNGGWTEDPVNVW